MSDTYLTSDRIGDYERMAEQAVNIGAKVVRIEPEELLKLIAQNHDLQRDMQRHVPDNEVLRSQNAHEEIVKGLQENLDRYRSGMEMIASDSPLADSPDAIANHVLEGGDPNDCHE